MKLFKCPSCKTVREKEDKIKMVQCRCGNYMEQVDSNHNPLTEAMKTCDKNKCEDCPIRGTKCFGVYQNINNASLSASNDANSPILKTKNNNQQHQNVSSDPANGGGEIEGSSTSHVDKCLRISKLKIDALEKEGEHGN